MVSLIAIVISVSYGFIFSLMFAEVLSLESLLWSDLLDLGLHHSAVILNFSVFFNSRGLILLLCLISKNIGLWSPPIFLCALKLFTKSVIIYEQVWCVLVEELLLITVIMDAGEVFDFSTSFFGHLFQEGFLK